MFCFPGTAALMLAQHTYMGDAAITNWLRNYGRSGDVFTVKSTRAGNHHWRVQPARGGFLITPTAMRFPQPAR